MGMSENRAQRAVLERLFALQDTKYRAFQSKLMPTVAPETVIGVRTPLLRNLAKELAGTAEAADFLREHGMAVFAEQEDSVSYLVVPEAAHELADAMELPEAERTALAQAEDILIVEVAKTAPAVEEPAENIPADEEVDS
mgnify:CR=1 FL=1